MDATCPKCETSQSISFEQIKSEARMICIQCAVPLKISFVAEVAEPSDEMSPSSEQRGTQISVAKNPERDLSPTTSIATYIPLFENKVIAVCIDGEATSEVVIDLLEEVHFRVRDISADVPGFLSQKGDSPDVALVDAGFTTVAGSEICAELKNRSEFEGIIVVLIGSMFERKAKNAEKEAPRFGADAYIERSQLSKALLPKLAILLEKQDLGEENQSTEDQDKQEIKQAKAFATIVVSDIILQNEAKVEEGVYQGTFYQVLETEIAEGETLYRSKVAEKWWKEGFYDEIVTAAISERKALQASYTGEKKLNLERLDHLEVETADVSDEESFSSSGFESDEALGVSADESETHLEVPNALGSKADTGFYEKREEKQEAERLAGIIVSDIWLYHEKKITEALENDNFYTALENEIKEGRALFESRVDKSLYFSSIYENSLESALQRRKSDPFAKVAPEEIETGGFETPAPPDFEEGNESPEVDQDAWAAWQGGAQDSEEHSHSEVPTPAPEESVPEIPVSSPSEAEPKIVLSQTENSVAEDPLVEPQVESLLEPEPISEVQTMPEEQKILERSEAVEADPAVFPPVDDFAPTTVFEIPKHPSEFSEEDEVLESPEPVSQAPEHFTEKIEPEPVSPPPSTEEKDAIRLAKIIVSDIVIYNEKKVEEGLSNQTFFSILAEEIEEGRILFESRVNQDLLASGFYRSAIDNFIQQRTGVASPELPKPLNPPAEAKAVEGDGIQSEIESSLVPSTPDSEPIREPSAEEKDAIRLAKIIVSDIVIYNEKKVEEGLKMRTFYSVLEEEIEEGRLLFESRVPASLHQDRLYETAIKDFIKRRTETDEASEEVVTPVHQTASEPKAAPDDFSGVKAPDIASSVADDDFFEEPEVVPPPPPVAAAPAPAFVNPEPSIEIPPSEAVLREPAPAPSSPVSAELGEKEKGAVRLAKIIVSDIVIYNEKKVEEGLKSGSFYSILEEEIEEGRQLFESRVSEALHQAGIYESAIKDFIKQRSESMGLASAAPSPVVPTPIDDPFDLPDPLEGVESEEDESAEAWGNDDFADQSFEADPAPAPVVENHVEEETEEEKNAKRLAKIIVSDIVIYNEKKVERGLQEGNFYRVLSEEIFEGKQLYETRVAKKILEKRNYFKEAFEDYIKRRSSSLS